MYIQSLLVIRCVQICFLADLSCMYLYVCAYHVHMVHVSLGEFIFECIGMYEHVCVSICLYVCISTIQKYHYICVCICMYCMYLCHILAISICIVCICPDQHSSGRSVLKLPAPGTTTSGPHSG